MQQQQAGEAAAAGALVPAPRTVGGGYLDEEVASLKLELENAKREVRNTDARWEQEMMAVVSQVRLAREPPTALRRAGLRGRADISCARVYSSRSLSSSCAR